MSTEMSNAHNLQRHPDRNPLRKYCDANREGNPGTARSHSPLQRTVIWECPPGNSRIVATTA
jgi:hypothetical protein